MTGANGLGGLRGVSWAVAAFSVVTTGCAAQVDEAAPTGRAAEPVAAPASALSIVVGPVLTVPDDVDCNSSNWNVVQAIPVGSKLVRALRGVGDVLFYQGRVGSPQASGSLLYNVCNTASSEYDADVCQFTTEFAGIAGAAGYFYVTKTFTNTPVEGDPNKTSNWVTIPIIDSQVGSAAPVTSEPTYPGLSSVRFPAFATQDTYSGPVSLYTWAQENPVFWPETNGAPDGVWVTYYPAEKNAPFILSYPNQTALANVLASPAARTPTVAAEDQTCVLVVDANGDVLDFLAHAAQWDPSGGCPECGLVLPP
jgi:hypothetical protein